MPLSEWQRLNDTELETLADHIGVHTCDMCAGRTRDLIAEVRELRRERDEAIAAAATINRKSVGLINEAVDEVAELTKQLEIQIKERDEARAALEFLPEENAKLRAQLDQAQKRANEAEWNEQTAIERFHFTNKKLDEAVKVLEFYGDPKTHQFNIPIGDRCSKSWVSAALRDNGDKARDLLARLAPARPTGEK